VIAGELSRLAAQGEHEEAAAAEQIRAGTARQQDAAEHEL
jgi:hypothetical protein